MRDIDSIAEMFAALEGHIELSYVEHGGYERLECAYAYFSDKHADADTWLAANDTERARLALVHKARLEELVSYMEANWRNKVTAKESRKRWRKANPKATAAAHKRWRTKYRDRELAKRRAYVAKTYARTRERANYIRRQKTGGKCFGERINHAKLTDAKVRQIRARSAECHKSLAIEYGVSIAAINKVISGASWKHVV